MRVEHIAEGVSVYLGDCKEIMPLLGRFDAVVTDPPYGMGVDVRMHIDSGTQRGTQATSRGHYEATGWDNETPGSEVFDAIRAISRHQIIFGGNYFPLPPSRCWLVWDKENGDNEYADCELAWTNLDKPVRRVKWMWNGMLRKGQEARHGHPTQKPLEVMRWCLGQLPTGVATILDPFLGSGTTGCAAVKMGFGFAGIERHEPYFDIACRRISDALARPDLFVAPRPPKTIQEKFL